MSLATSHTIARFTLRTTDVPGAAAFYAALLGPALPPIVPLHEQAILRGARSHWLGQIEVPDVESSVRAFLEHGAELLGPAGPLATFPDGRRFAVLRDPGGAIVGLTSPGGEEEPRVVVWHQLNTNDRKKVEEAYGRVFGWRLTRVVSHPQHGEFQHFAWPSGDAEAGAVVDIQGRSGRHPHWLFHMRVTELDRKLELVRGAGGTALGPFELPDGDRVAVCDDPQGAAFALRG